MAEGPVKRSYAITPNLQKYVPKNTRISLYQDKLERRPILKVELTPKKARELWNIGEEIGGWVVRFEPENAEFIKYVDRG